MFKECNAWVQDHGLQVLLLSETADCVDSLLEAADSHQDWSSFLKGLFGDFSGERFQPLRSLPPIESQAQG